MKLFEPITIKGVGFKNRIVMAPMRLRIGPTSPRARAFYLERAKGGVGTIMTGATSVDLLTTDEAWGKTGGVDAFLEEVRSLTHDIHGYGAKMGVQLWHGNLFPAGTGTPEDIRGEPVAPSPSAQQRELTVSEIETIISRFAQAAINARKAGFDFVEIHGAHAYLVCQFFSPVSNRRNDEYGGDLTRRMRFGTQCVSAVRASVGDDYPIFYRLGARDYIPGGITVDDSARFAAEIEKAGADVIDVSIGGMAGPGGSYAVPVLLAMPGPEQPEGTFVPLAEAVKQQVNVPVIAVGRFRTPHVAEEVLAQGKADMVSIGRQIIADPSWPVKVANDRIEDITPCISCNSCFETRLDDLGFKCSVNPFACREAEWTVVSSPKPKKVIVAGSGPAGMEAAWVARMRGHDVTIYERQGELGGQLIPAALPPYKQELMLLRRYLARQLEKSAVQVRLGIEVTPELVEKEKPEFVILATGSIPRIPEIPGISKKNVVTAVDVILGRVDVGEKVVVIGGELVGCETADFLSQRGKKITVVRRGLEMAAKMFPGNRESLLARLKEKGVVLITGVKEYEAVADDGLIIIDGQGNRQTIEAETIVIAAGALPNNQLVTALEGKVGEIHLAGDCSEPRRILDAIHDGARLGLEI